MYGKSPLPSPVYAWNASYADKLAEHINAQKFDGAISPHLYGMLALTEAKKRSAIKVPIFGVGTDYTTVPFTRDTLMDEFFLPHKDLILPYIKNGIDKTVLNPTGIPVSPKIASAPEKESRAKFFLYRRIKNRSHYVGRSRV